jgi:macrolide-specific efflux system membrane fusion protein
LIIGRSSNSGDSYKKVAVEVGDLEITILSTGIVQPENRLEIKPPISGRIEDVLVDEGQYVKKGHVLVLMSSTERAALIDAARARGPEELKRWQTFYRPAPILAPIDGTIILRSVEPGQSFTTADAVLVMSDRLTVKAQVDETDIAEVKLGQKADVILDAYPDDNIPAHVDKIAYDATTINNVTTYIVDVLPEETPEYMRSGMTANVRFAVASEKGVLLLPVNAVKNREGHQFVMPAAQSAMGGPAEKEVETGLSNGKQVEIVSGLQKGDIVLVKQPKSGSAGNSSTPFGPPNIRRR